MNIDDFFKTFEGVFGGGGGPFGGFARGGGFGRPSRGQDLQMGLTVSFLDAARGTSKDVEVAYAVVDQRGRPRRVSRKVTVNIPAGVDSGMNLRIQGEGGEAPEPGMSAGHLYLEISVERDPYFSRDGADIHVEVSVPFTTALLGGEVEVCTLDGLVDMKIPGGTQPGSVLVLRGKGLPIVNGRGAGDQHVHIQVDFPKQLTQQQKDILEQFRRVQSPPSGAKSRLDLLKLDAEKRLKRHSSK